MNQLLPAFKRKQKQQQPGIELFGWTLEDITNTYGQDLCSIQENLKRHESQYRITGFRNPTELEVILGMQSLYPIRRSRDNWVYIDPDERITIGSARRGPRLIVELV